MIYNEEQWKIIANAEPHFNTARHDYIRNVPRQMTEQIVSVYEAATGRQIFTKDYSCAVCVLRIYQTIGNTYYKDLEERTKNKNNENNINQDGKSENTPNKEKCKKQARNKTKKGGGS